MDPLSAAASVIAVIQITGAVLKLCNEYRKSVKQAPEEAEQIVSQLNSLQIVLQQVLLVAEREKQSRPNATSSLSKLVAAGGELEICKESLLGLQKKLEPREGWKAVKDTLTWHFKAGEFRKTLDRIANSRDVLNLALTTDNALITLGIQDEVATLTASFNSASLDAKQQKALDWLAASASFDKQNSARRKHQATTGAWFLGSPEYASWKTGDKRFFWLHGIPGCGKTVLCSCVINALSTHCKITPKTALAYFYFDFNNNQEANLTSMLRSIVTQLATQDLEALKLLVEEHNNHDSGRRPPSIEALTSLIVDMFGIYSNVFVVVDALDECQDRDELLNWLDDIHARNTPSVRLFFSSRKEKDIDDVLKPLISIEVLMRNTDVDPDIRLYVKNRLSTDRKLKKWPVQVQEEIEESLMTRVNGMFRMAECQLDMLCRCNNIVALRKQLQSLPRTLDGTYDQILAAIDQENADDALKVLQWLSFSARPLLLTEIVDVLAIDDYEMFKFNPDLRYTDPYDILTVCSSLITINPRTIHRDPWGPKENVQELKLAHLSVKEYLISERIANSPQNFYSIREGTVNVNISRNCILYLTQFKEYGVLNKENITDYPLATYAAKYWPTHAGKVQRDKIDRDYRERIAAFLSNVEICRNWLSLWNPDARISTQSDLEYIELDKPINDKEIKPPLYYACLFGLSEIAQVLFEQMEKVEDMNEIAGEKGTLLNAAASSGNLALVELLIGKGSDINAKGGETGSALAAAAEAGHEEVVSVLLAHGADPNVPGGFFGSALQAAAYQGNCKIVNMLLQHGALTNLKGNSYGSALSAAIDRGHEDVVEALLAHGVDINAQTMLDDSAIHSAASKGPLRTVKLLLSKGAKIDLEGHYGGTPLLSAVISNHLDIIQYLLEQHANPNVIDTLWGTTLYNAAERGCIEAVRLLLLHGANVNDAVRETGTPLAVAASKGYVEIVDLLLSSGADAKAGSALQAAMQGKRLDIAQKLIDQGASIHEYSGEYGYPLQSAAASRNLAVVEFLVKNGADINARGGTFGTALQASVSPESASMAIAQYLIAEGADVNARCGSYDSPLQAAAQNESDNPAMVKLLLKHGANVNLRAGRTCTALHAACEMGNFSIVKVLLQAGAEIDARHDDGRTPLNVAITNEKSGLAEILLTKGATVNWRNDRNNDLYGAASNGLTQVVEKILDLGADVNGIDESDGSVLHGAAREGHITTVKLLIARGANVNASGSRIGEIIHIAAASENLRALQVLVEAGADVHQTGGCYHTALQAAAEAEEFKNVQYLLSLGVDVNAQGGEFGTALQAAASNGDRNIVKTLLNAGAQVNLNGGKYGNALQAAAQVFSGASPVIKILIDAGADINAIGGEYGHSLQAAAQSTSFENVKILVSNGAEVNVKGGTFGTAILAAADEGSLEIFEYLLAKGADSFIDGPEGTALYHAGVGGNEKIIQRLLDLGHNIANSWGDRGSALKRTIEAGSIKAFKKLVEAGAAINETCGSDGSALLTAIRQSESEYLDIMLKAGADVNVQFPEGYQWEPAEEWRKSEAASHEGWESNVDVNEQENENSSIHEDFIASGSESITRSDGDENGAPEIELSETEMSEADADAEAPRYFNALHEALCQEDEDIKQLILSKTTNVNAPGGTYGNSLQAALVHCHLGLVQQILDRGADIHAVGGEFNNALQAAASTGELRRVEFVLSLDPQVNKQGGKWGNALQAAAQGGYIDVVEHLLQAGAEVNAQGGNFLTTLQAAAHEGHLDIAKLLISNGADVNVHNEDDGDALQAAASQGHVKIVRLLLKHKAAGNRTSKQYKNALQAATDGGYTDVIQALIRGKKCFRRGVMLEEAIKSLEVANYFNLAQKMRTIAEACRDQVRERIET